MKPTNLLIAIVFLMTFATYAQSEENQHVEPRTAVTELKVESENIEELRNFDWKMVKELFHENDASEEITLVFTYVNKSEIEKSEVRVDNFEMRLTGKTADIDKLTSRLKNSFEKLDDMNRREVKN